MKKHIIKHFIFLLLFSFIANSSKTQIIINSLSANYIYAGIKNKLQINNYYKNTKIDSITTDNGNIIYENKFYYLHPIKIGYVNMKIYLNKNKKKLIEKTKILAISLPKPHVGIGGYNLEFLPQTIKNINGIYAIIDIPTDRFMLEHNSISYNITFFHSDTLMFLRKQIGLIELELRKILIENAAKGDKIRFDDIKVIGKLGETIDIDYILEITEK